MVQIVKMAWVIGMPVKDAESNGNFQDSKNFIMIRRANRLSGVHYGQQTKEDIMNQTHIMTEIIDRNHW